MIWDLIWWVTGVLVLVDYVYLQIRVGRFERGEKYHEDFVGLMREEKSP